jgi:signal transduction histidine kinase/ActR/RegA family two-component response regulator
MSLPVKYHLALILVGLNVVGAGVVAGFAYRTSRQSLEDQARLAVGSVAQAHQQATVRLLERRQERLNAFLASLESLCGERNPRGVLSLERECIRVALIGLRTAERATAVELRYGTRRLAARGAWRTPVESPGVGVLAAMTDVDGRTEYTMRTQRGRLTLRARFSLGDLEPIFQDRSGLGENGEMLLANAQGVALFPVRYSTPPALSDLLAMTSVQQCLAGESGEMLTRDYRDAMVISGFRPAAAIAGACVIANLQYSDVLVPIGRLGRTFTSAAAALVVLGIALSLMVSHAIAKPITRLVASARAMQQGRFEQSAGGGGPMEVRQLAEAFSSMTRSIGELVQREHTARLEAEAASRFKDEFLATLSHELRTPLTAILGWASIVTRGHANDARAAHAMKAIERSARTQARLVEELLDVSRLVSGQMRLSLSAVSLNTVVDEALEGVRPAAEAKKLELVKRSATPPRTIRADAGRLQQIVWNLLSNAVRFTPPGGRIEISVVEVDGQAEIRVTDTGIGIQADFVPHVFERFRQADSSTTRSHGGLGLGLAIVRHLVELHGGTVRAESEGEGRGATFVVQLPIRADAPAVVLSADATVRRDPLTMLHGTRVLVVDDDPDAREILRAMLEDAGATVATTASAGETRAIMGQLRPDLLIADIGMPNEDGYSLIRSVRALESEVTGHVPAIALTAHARAEDIDRAFASGFQVHVAKPVEAAQLLSTIATLVHPPA